MPKPPWPSTASIRYSCRRKPGARARLAVAGGAPAPPGAAGRSDRGGQPGRGARGAWGTGRAGPAASSPRRTPASAPGRSDRDGQPVRGAGASWETVRSSSTASSSRLTCGSDAAVRSSPTLPSDAADAPRYHRRPGTTPETLGRTETYNGNVSNYSNLMYHARCVIGGARFGHGHDSGPVHHGRLGGELLRRRDGRVPQLLQVQEH